MSIVLVGGHDCMQNEYKKIFKHSNHRVKVFTQMPARFNKAIGTPDALIIFTSTVSHKMVRIANKEAKKKNIPIFKAHSSSQNALIGILEEIKSSIS